MIHRIALSDPIESAYRRVAETLHSWGSYSISQMTIVIDAMQDVRWALAAIAAANTVVFYTAWRVVQWVGDCLENQLPYDHLSMEEQWIRGASLSVVFFGTVAGANWAFCHALSIRLAIWKVVVISSLVFIMCFFMTLPKEQE